MYTHVAAIYMYNKTFSDEVFAIKDMIICTHNCVICNQLFDNGIVFAACIFLANCLKTIFAEIRLFKKTSLCDQRYL